MENEMGELECRQEVRRIRYAWGVAGKMPDEDIGFLLDCIDDLQDEIDYLKKAKEIA